MSFNDLVFFLRCRNDQRIKSQTRTVAEPTNINDTTVLLALICHRAKCDIKRKKSGCLRVKLANKTTNHK